MDRDGYKWEGFKTMRAKFTPKFCKLKDKDGNRIPESQYAQKAADYLGGVQWKKPDNLPPDTLNPNVLTGGEFPTKDSDCTIEAKFAQNHQKLGGPLCSAA